MLTSISRSVLGLYNPIERGDESFAETYYGGDKPTGAYLPRRRMATGGRSDQMERVRLVQCGLADTPLTRRSRAIIRTVRETRLPGVLDILCHIDYHILEHWIGIGDWHDIVMA